MSKMVNRIVLLLLVMVLALACGGTPTPEFVYPTPETPPVLVETVALEGGEAVRVICYGGPLSTSIRHDEVIVYCSSWD